jgi:hypothetical protein
MTPKGKPYPEGTLPGSYQDERGEWRAPDGSLLTTAWLVTPEQARQRRQREALQANHAKQGPNQTGPGLACHLPLAANQSRYDSLIRMWLWARV